MHLPFTFATGEALLYQTGYPLHGFPDSIQGKAKGSKSKKGKLERSSSDDLDPKSLLGALMSQDESVYVCQPDTEPKMSYHSSIFSEQQSDGGGFSGLLSSDSWHIISNGEMARCNGKTSSYDPLLATLDSLSLEEDELCSNSELFSALENLGLNAEDLELLLLDERMIQVEMDPNHIPTLSDLLTNNEILSYIQDSLGSETNGEEQGDGFGPSTRPPNPDSTQSTTQQVQACPAAPPAAASCRQPIVQLSQQMQQHMNPPEQIRCVSQRGPADTNILSWLPNSRWVFTAENTRHPPQTAVKASPVNGEQRPLDSGLWHLQQEQQEVHLQPHQQVNSQSSLLPGFQNQTNGVFIPNGHTAFPCNVEAGQSGPNGHYQTVSAPSYQLQGHQKHQQQTQVAPTSCLPQRPVQSSELDQFLSPSQPQHGLPSVDAYSMFNTAAQEAPHGKVRLSC